MVLNGSNSNHVWVGSELGLLKGVNFSSGIFMNYGDLKCVDKSQGVTAISISKSTGSSKVILGLKDGSVKTYDIDLAKYTDAVSCGTGPVSGLVTLDNGSLLTCTQDGLLKHWKENECILEKKIGSDTEKIVGCSSHSLIAAGGKENDLKIWNIETMEKPVFAAKNVRNDFLNLRVPVWVTAIDFFKDSKDQVVIGSGNHQVRVYDARVQRRPMLDVEYHEHPITAISLTNGNNTVIVGNSAGYMAELDLRTGKVAGGFKGNSGSIRDICCHVSQPYVVSCGLDRIIKLYDLKTRSLAKKVYLKSNLNCFHLTEDEITLSDGDSRKRTIDESGDVVDIPDDEEEGEDAVWEEMQVVKEKKKKKNEHVDN